MSYYKHAYQSLSCETAINTDFSELFSLKHIYVKYKNAILSLIIASFAHERIRHMVKYFSRHLITTYGKTRSQDRTNQISGKVHAYLSNSFMCQRSKLNVTNSILIFYINIFKRK